MSLPDPGTLDVKRGFSVIRVPSLGVVDKAEGTAQADGQEVEVRIARCKDVDLDGPQAVDIDSGVKVWEGGLDLAGHIAGLDSQTLPQGAQVLELGAGHGLPGIVAAMRHGARVDFHDRSPDVLRTVTAPNVAVNCPALAAAGAAPGEAEAGAGRGSPRFLAGDWQELRGTLEASGLAYDVVLAAEAIYRTEAYPDLAALLSRCLARDGVAWFAGKRFYFGCGGGTASFMVFLREHGFVAEVERAIEDGRSNVRDIIRVTRGGGVGAGGNRGAEPPDGEVAAGPGSDAAQDESPDSKRRKLEEGQPA